MPQSSATSGGIAAVRNASLNRLIPALALPAIVANITTPLLSLVDIAIVGHLGSASYVGAIAVGGSVFNMLYWLFGFLRFGTSGLTAQAVGAGDSEARMLTGVRSSVIAVALGLMLIVLQVPLGRLALGIMDPDASTRVMAETYFSILIYGAPAVLLQYSLTGWFVGSQNTRTPMVVALVINVVNIAASLVLVYCFNLGIRGVAAGTLIAQWTGCLLALALARLSHLPLRRIFRPRELYRFFSINADIFLRTLCLITVTVWFTRAGALQGATMLAVNTLLLQLFTLFSYFMDGFAFAAEALCGKAYGAGDFQGLRRCIRTFLMWGGGVAAVFTVLYVAGGDLLLRVLTDDVDVLEATRSYRLWAYAVPLAGFMAFTADGIAIGMTRTRAMLGSIFIATGVYFALYFPLRAEMGNHALWCAFLAYLLVRGLMLTRTLVARVR